MWIDQTKSNIKTCKLLQCLNIQTGGIEYLAEGIVEFVALHLDDFSIVGLAFGMSGLAFRLPEESIPEALRDGGAIAVELGPTWVRFEPWTDRETLAQSRERLARWCAAAAGTPAS